MFALSSLYEIVKTFKRVLLFQVYMRKSATEKEQMVTALSNKQGTGTRMLARVMSNMPNNSTKRPMLQDDPSAPHKGIAHSALGPHHDESDRSRATSSSIWSRRSPTLSRSSIGATHMTSVPELSPAGIQCATEQLPSGTSCSTGKQAHAAHQPHSAGPSQHSSSTGDRTLPRVDSVKGQDGGALASSRAAFKEMRENNLCMAIAQDIQRLEVGAADTVGTVDAVQHISFCPRCFAPMLQNDRHGHPQGGAPITTTIAHMQMVDTPCPVSAAGNSNI